MEIMDKVNKFFPTDIDHDYDHWENKHCYYDDDDDWDNDDYGYYEDKDYTDDDDYGYTYYEEQAIKQPSYQIGSVIYANQLEIAKILKQQNMICLASSFLLIADIDCGEKVNESLNRLKQFLNINEANFLVYRTKNGMRYLQTDCLYQGANNSAIKVLKQLGSDPQYISLCKKGKQFMARLTPKKQEKERIDYWEKVINNFYTDVSVCHFIGEFGTKKTIFMLEDAIQAHNQLTKAPYKNTFLA